MLLSSLTLLFPFKKAILQTGPSSIDQLILPESLDGTCSRCIQFCLASCEKPWSITETLYRRGTGDLRPGSPPSGTGTAGVMLLITTLEDTHEDKEGWKKNWILQTHACRRGFQHNHLQHRRNSQGNRSESIPLFGIPT